MLDPMVWKSRIGFEAKGLRNSASVGRFNVYIKNTDLHTIVVLAERQDNPGASITNAYESYAAAVCKMEGIEIRRSFFYELYLDPGGREGSGLTIEKDGIRGSASLDRVEIDESEAETRWMPGGRLGEVLWRSLRESVELDWSYPVNERRLNGYS